MNRVIAVANQKGGVGKTTTAVNLAASLTATKRRTLLIDLDPQGNATMGCGIDKNAVSRTSCDVMLGECAAAEALLPVEYGGFMLMPGNQDLTVAEVRLLTMNVGREFKLRSALKPIRDQFDIILVDCPPSLNMLTLNALVAADSVMVPMQCEYYALEGLSALTQTIEQIRGSLNSELEKMEKPAGIGNPKDFRHEIVNHVLRAQNKTGGQKLVWTSYQKLREVIEKRMFAATDDLLPVVSYFAKGSAEDDKKHQAFIARMQTRGHTPTQVRRQVEWWTMARRQ